MPIRTSYTPHANLDRPSSPLAQSRDKRGDTHITQAPSRREHKKIYSVDDSSHSTQLVAEREIVEPPRHRDTVDRGYSVTSGGRSYHNSKPPPRLTDLGDDGYSYTDPASMYRDTEPAWRRPRAGSLERGSRPTSMIVDRPARNSARELGPPPSLRGFDKINSGVSRSHGRSSSIDRSRDVPKYDPYPETGLGRSSSTRQHAPAVHQEPREPRRDTYHDDYDRRGREVENRRHSVVDRFEDRDVASRGFGIAQGHPSLAHDHHVPDRQPIYNPQEIIPVRPEELSSPYHSTHRAEVRMPEPRIPNVRDVPDPRSSRERDLAPKYDTYEERPRERESSKRDSGRIAPTVAGATAGVAATLGAAGYMKSREREKDRDSERDSSGERERRKERDERDRRDKYDDRRERRSDERDEKRDRRPDDYRPEDRRLENRGIEDRRPEDRRAHERRDVPPPTATYAPPPDPDRKPRERRYEDEDKERPARKAPSSEGSGDERPRHYVERDAERRKDPAPKEPALDPDEEYRRRVQQEAERSGRAARERDNSVSDHERDRRRRKDERSRSRGPEERSRASPPTVKDSSAPRQDDRSLSIYDGGLVQEPSSIDRRTPEGTSKSVQIVTPSKESPVPVKGILRKPTAKFPEDPEPIREGVAPHKDALKGKDIPVGARWTRIDRRLVNPEALEEAKERFEERMDCVIVLRVLEKQEIQKLADRTKKLREARGE